MSIEELSIEQKNRLITEKILGECFHVAYYHEYEKMNRCELCQEALGHGYNRNFYEGDRSYKDIADALAKVPANTKMKSGFTQRGFLTHELWKRPGWEVVEHDGGEEYVDQPWAFMTFSPPDVANALVAMILETKQ